MVDSVDNMQLYQAIENQFNDSVVLQGKCKDTSRQLELCLQTLKERVENNKIDKECQDFRRTVIVLSKYEEVCKSFDACSLQDRVLILIKDVELLIQKHENGILKKALMRRDSGRKQRNPDKDSAYGSATSTTLTDSQYQLSSTNVETLVQSPSAEQDTSSFAVVPSCSNYRAEYDKSQRAQIDSIGTRPYAEDDHTRDTGASN